MANITGPATASAQQQSNIKFSHLTTVHGLSQSAVHAILKDKYGFMWFGTEDGLNKYDGYKFTVYRHNPKDSSSLRANSIQVIYEDSKGNLWIGGNGGGLSLYDRAHDAFIHYRENFDDYTTLSSSDITSIYEDKQGNLWIGTYWNLNLLDRKTKKAIRLPHSDTDASSISNDVILTMFEDSKGNFWIGTDKGLNLMDRKNKTFKRYLPNPADPKSISGYRIRAIAEDDKENLWIGTEDGGLNLYDKGTDAFIKFQQHPKNVVSDRHIIDNNIYALENADDGNLWIGTEGGLDYFNTKTGYFTHYKNSSTNDASLSHNSINSILLDNDGILWVGTFAGGINKFDKNLSLFTHFKKDVNNTNSLNHNIVTSFAQKENGDLWIGTDGGGLDLYDKEKDKFIHYTHNPGVKSSLASNSVLALLIDREKNLWIGTYDGGLNRYNEATNSFIQYGKGDKPGDLSSNSVFALLEDRRGDIWIGTNEGGVNVLNKATQTITRYRYNPHDMENSLVNDDVRCFYEDKTGNIWIGTYVGLSCINPITKKITNYNTENSNLAGHAVFTIYEDSKGNLWVGTLGALNVLNKTTKKFTAFREEEGLINNVVNYITEDARGDLWISTNKGITRFKPETKSFHNYTISNGLQSFEFFHGSGYRSKHGEMYFGGINGFNVFHPGYMEDNKNKPAVVLTGFQLFNKPVEIDKKNSPLQQHISIAKTITLLPGQSVFTLEFAALNYTLPENNQYAYMLEGFDDTWNYVGTQRKATYTNLDPGEYVFRVKASNNDGVWNEEAASIKIIITPPFWATWWFKLLAALSIAGGTIGFFRLRISNINAKKIELERLVKERTESLALMTEEERKARKEAEEANRAKSVFLATMSHEIRTPMNGVIGTASLLAETKLDTEQQRYAEIIRSSGENLLSVINDILDFSKIESGKMELEQQPFDLRYCIEEVLDLFATKASEVGLDLVYQMEHNVPSQIIGDCVRLKQVLINLVANAIKFTKKGEVFVGIKVTEARGDNMKITFEVRDTGIGIPENKIDRLFQAFSQVDSSTSRKYGGTGLGLAICKRLVELMNGEIEVHSEVDKGTRFRFTISTQASTEAVRSYMHCNVSELEGKRILVVDDNETNRFILKTQLENWKFITVLAASGAEALQCLAEGHEFDMVISDMQMPEMDGVELAQLIKKQYPQLPLVLLSSIGDERGKKYEQLFSTVLTKPVKQQQLCKTIVSHFKKNNMAGQREVQQQKLSVNFAHKYPMEILIAEDNPVNQLLAVMILKKLGYRPDTALDGLKVLEALSVKDYDLILMDMQMPEMDGLEATQWIRQKPGKQPIIIAATANAMKDDKEMCIQSGMDDYISKPIELEVLVNMLEKWAQIRQNKKQQIFQ